MSHANVALTDANATTIVAADANYRVSVTRITLTNRHATTAVSVIVLDGSTEITRYHLAAAGGQVNIGKGDPAFPVWERNKHTLNTAFKLQQSVNQDGVVGDVQYNKIV